MSLLKEWNTNFKKGVTSYQIFLMLSMIMGSILNNNFLILFSMANCIFGYLELNSSRYSLGTKNG